MGKPFEVLAPDTRHVFVSSPTDIKELDKTPDHKLSLYAASSHVSEHFIPLLRYSLTFQMLQPQYTMHGYSVFDKKGAGGFGFVRAVRTLLTRNIPKVLPNLTVVLKKRFKDLLFEHPVVKGTVCRKLKDIFDD